MGRIKSYRLDLDARLIVIPLFQGIHLNIISITNRDSILDKQYFYSLNLNSHLCLTGGGLWLDIVGL